MEAKTAQKRRKYDADFKQEVLKMVANGRSIVEISTSLGIGSNLIHKWKSRSGSKGPLGPKVNLESSDISFVADYEALKIKFKQLEQERDILKKALGIFSREG